MGTSPHFVMFVNRRATYPKRNKKDRSCRFGERSLGIRRMLIQILREVKLQEDQVPKVRPP